MFIKVPNYHETSPALKTFWLRAYECLSHKLRDTDSDVKSTFYKKNIDKIIFAHCNVSFMRNKLDQLCEMNKEHIGVLMISESKLDKSFPNGQFLLEGYGPQSYS